MISKISHVPIPKVDATAYKIETIHESKSSEDKSRRTNDKKSV